MARTKTIGGGTNSSSKQCAYCDADIGASDFWQYVSSPANSYVLCFECQEINELLPSDDSRRTTIRLALSWGLGLLIAGPAIIYLFYTIYLAFFTQASFSISGAMTAFFIGLGVLVAKYVDHVMSWFGGTLYKKNDTPMMQFISGDAVIQSDDQQ